MGSLTRMYASPLHDQEIRSVGIRELQRRTSKVVRDLREGERLIVLRHADPVAVLLPIRDLLEEMAILRGLAEASRRVDRMRLEPAPWRPLPGRLIFFEPAARRAFVRMPAPDRASVRKQLRAGEFAAAPVPIRGLWSESGRVFVLFELLTTGSVAVRHVYRRRELEPELFGPELTDRRLIARLDRGVHGRWRPPR